MIPVGYLDAEKISEAVWLYVFRIALKGSHFTDTVYLGMFYTHRQSFKTKTFTGCSPKSTYYIKKQCIIQFACLVQQFGDVKGRGDVGKWGNFAMVRFSKQRVSYQQGYAFIKCLFHA